jgi:hypothetical protein
MRSKWGRWQRSYANDLLRGYDMPVSANACLRGKAKQYVGKYQQSINTVLADLEAEGYELIRTPGPRGGKGMVKLGGLLAEIARVIRA